MLGYQTNYVAADTALENELIPVICSLPRTAIHLSFKLGANPNAYVFLRPKRNAHFLFFSIKSLAHAFNEYMLIESARILLARFFKSLRLF